MKRKIQKKNKLEPDRGHVRPRLLDIGLNPTESILVIYGLTVLSLIIGIIIVYL